MRHQLRYIFIITFLSFAISSVAQTVGYKYKAKEGGCDMEYSVLKQDTSYYIIATVCSDCMKFTNEPTIKVRTFNDEVFTLKGCVIDGSSKTTGLVIGHMIIPLTEISSTSQFSITPNEFEMLKNGVSKVRLSMTPINHERTFKKDKIGKKLYEFYLKAKTIDDDF